jgi:hypothetical protein
VFGCRIDTAFLGRLLLDVAVALTLVSMVYYIRKALPDISDRTR